MNKYIKIICLVLTIVFLFASCASDVPAGKKTVTLYFGNSDCSDIASETGYIDESAFDDTVILVKEVMKKLLSGPSASHCSPVLPEGLTLRGVSMSKADAGVVNIDLGGNYYQNSTNPRYASDELLSRYTIVCTLCQFDGIRKVKFYINGQDLRDSGGKGDIVKALGKENVLMNSPSSVETQTEKFVTLYFTKENGRRLYPETRKATMSDNSIEKTIVTELIRGPVSDKYTRAISFDTELISIETAEEVCFVNLSSGFTSKMESGSIEEKLAVYSIVNSLTNVAGIEKVQILIDGKKPEKDVNQLFSTPLERSQQMIEETKAQ